MSVASTRIVSSSSSTSSSFVPSLAITNNTGVTSNTDDEEESIGTDTTSNIGAGSFRSCIVDWRAVFDDYQSPEILYAEQLKVEDGAIKNFMYQGTHHNGKWGITLNIVCYLDKKEKTMYCFYKSFKSEQSTLLNYSYFCIANLGLIAFLLQVFQTRDWITLIIIVSQLLFLILCIAQMCIIRWAFAVILNEHTREIKTKKYITAIVMVRADNFCLELDVNSFQQDNDLELKASALSVLKWSVLALLQILTIIYFILCVFRLPLPSI